MTGRRRHVPGWCAAIGLSVALGTAAGAAQVPSGPPDAAPADGTASVVLKAVAWRRVAAEVTLVTRNAEGVEQELSVISDRLYEALLIEPGPWTVRPASGSGFWGRGIHVDLDLDLDLDLDVDPATDLAIDLAIESGAAGELPPEGSFVDGPPPDADAVDGPPPEVVPVFEVPVFPAVTASGRVVGPAQAVAEVAILLGDVKRERMDPRFRLRGVRLDCPVADDGRWSCELPAALVHLAFWLPGHSPEYRWETPLFGRPEIDLGDQTLIPGASLAGFVAAAPDERVLGERCVVHVANADPSVWTTGVEHLVTTAGVALDGFFQAVGLGPGNHWIQVDCDNRVAARAGPWNLERNAETFPRKRVRIVRSHLADLFVTPLEPPGGGRWVARLQQIEPAQPAEFRRRYRTGEYPQQRALVENGRVQFHVPGNGAFRVEIADEAGGRFGGLDYLEIVGDAVASVDLDLVPVVGRLTLDGNPVLGLVFFGGPGASPHQLFRSGVDGWFHASLPDRQDWRVDVLAPYDGVMRFYRNVEVRADEPLILELTDIVVHGRVEMASTGRPAARALVRIESADGRFIRHAQVADDGGYSVRGLQPGWVRVSAEADDGALTAEPFETILEPRQSLDVNFRLQDPYD